MSSLDAVRASYDVIAEAYSAHFPDDLADRPLDRAMLAVFAELVASSGGGPVLDVGCGPGHTTARARSLGVDVAGIDLSPGMVAVANREHPELDVTVGSMLAIDRPDASLAGALCLFSLIHVPPPRRPEALAEVARVVRADGPLIVGSRSATSPGTSTTPGAKRST